MGTGNLGTRDLGHGDKVSHTDTKATESVQITKTHEMKNRMPRIAKMSYTSHIMANKNSCSKNCAQMIQMMPRARASIQKAGLDMQK